MLFVVAVVVCFFFAMLLSYYDFLRVLSMSVLVSVLSPFAAAVAVVFIVGVAVGWFGPHRVYFL